MTGIEALIGKPVEKTDLPINDELLEINELPNDIEDGNKTQIEPPDISYIERTSRSALLEQCSLKVSEVDNFNNSISETLETKSEGLTDEEKAKIKEEIGWSDKIIDNIANMKQYEVLKNAGLKEVEINGRECLIKENIDLDYADEDGSTNRERMARGLAPLNSRTGNPLELHHLGQKPDSPLVELTKEEHRTGEYEDGKKNQSLWHDNAKETEVHGEGNHWDQEKKSHWKERIENS